VTNNVVRLRQQDRVFAAPILTDDLDAFIPLARKLLEKAVKRQDRNLDMNDVISDLYAGRSALWLVYIGDTLVAAITTSVVRHPRRSTLFIEFVGGSRLKEWMEYVIGMFVHVAKDAGLDGIETDGRKGFERIYPETFKITHSHYEMEF